MSPAEAIDDEDNDEDELDLFRENEIFNLDRSYQIFCQQFVSEEILFSHF